MYFHIVSFGMKLNFKNNNFSIQAYDVVSFEGKKGIVLSSTTIFGQQNIFQGVATVSVGGISVILGVLFLLCGCSKRHGKG